MNTPVELIAWAAGLYDGEGSASTYVPELGRMPRRQMQVSQGGKGTLPIVLVRFREIVGHGNITGPYRGYLYYWKTTRKSCIDETAESLWPYLSDAKRFQLQSASLAAGRASPVTPLARDHDTEAAWAAGLFDAEGSFWLTKDDRYRPDWRGVSMELAQSTRGDVPETLRRFHAAVAVGHISGPRTLKSPWTKLPQYRWQVSGRHQVSGAVHVLWPWLSAVKRIQIAAARAHLNVEIDLS